MKTGATMGNDRGLADRLKDSVLGVTKKWATQRKREERDASARGIAATACFEREITTTSDPLLLR